MKKTIRSALTVRDLEFKNRVIVPPMASSTGSLEGEVTELTLTHYARLIEAQAALTIVEYTYVHRSGRSEENQLGADSDLKLEGLRQLAGAIKRGGGLAGIQLVHSGGKSSQALSGNQLMAPSARPIPVKGQILETPRAMTPADIDLWKSSFVAAVKRAVAAGFDLVEFHAAHGYGLNQFLSPLTNPLSESLEHRARLLYQIVSAARAEYPALLISVRIPGQDFLPGGLSLNDMIQVARRLQELGADLIHVSSGIGGWRRPVTRQGEGYLVDEARAIQAQIGAVVVGVGGIETAEYIERGLNLNWFQLAAVGRSILRDPNRWHLTLDASKAPHNHFKGSQNSLTSSI